MQLVGVFDLAQRYAIASRPRGHQCNIAYRHRPGTVVAPISSAPRYRRGERYIDGIGGGAGQFDRGKVTGVGRIRQASHLGSPPNSRESNDAVMQRRTATQDQVSAIRDRCWAVAGPRRSRDAGSPHPPATATVACYGPREPETPEPGPSGLCRHRESARSWLLVPSVNVVSCQRSRNHTGRTRARRPQSKRTLCHDRCGQDTVYSLES